MRRHQEYKSTTNNHVYNRIHIEKVTGCCLNCAKRERRGYYGWMDNQKGPKNYPSWKLVSKNRKQWMWKGKNFKRKESKSHNRVWIEFVW